LQHTNAVGVTDFGQTADGYVYIVMELLEGKTLRELLSKEAPLDVARSVSIMMQVSAAVAAAHDAGIIHRDLKPANIFIVQRSDVPALVKVLDFGIAKVAADFLDEDDHLTLTQVGAMIGTPRYMSPEQCSGSPLTAAADVYSLGVILYEMLTGTVPFSGSTPLAIAMKHSTEAPRRPSEFVATIPQALEDVVLHAMEKRPGDRPPNAEAFRLELFETAERLGLEHAGAASAPSIEALRSAGTPSTSGRLIVDLDRLRENRASTSGAGELTVIDTTGGHSRTVVREAPQLDLGPAITPPTAPAERSRVNISVADGANRSSAKALLIIAAVLIVVLLASVAFLLGRSRGAAAVPNANAVASPSPIVATPTPSPTPSPSPSPKEIRKPTPKKQEGEKKKGVGGTLKDIFLKPFKKKEPH
jgi:serine/threonine-protein kinase